MGTLLWKILHISIHYVKIGALYKSFFKHYLLYKEYRPFLIVLHSLLTVLDEIFLLIWMWYDYSFGCSQDFNKSGSRQTIVHLKLQEEVHPKLWKKHIQTDSKVHPKQPAKYVKRMSKECFSQSLFPLIIVFQRC